MIKVPDNIKKEITEESETYLSKLKENSLINIDDQYQGNTKDVRDKLGQFFTPPPLTIDTLEYFRFTNDERKEFLLSNKTFLKQHKDITVDELDLYMFSNKTVFDPTLGSGNLLMGCLILGLHYNDDYPSLIFGNELDEKILMLARKRFKYYLENYYKSKRKMPLTKYVYYDNLIKKYCNDEYWEYKLKLGDALKKEDVSIERWSIRE